MRMNVRAKCVEVRVCDKTSDPSSLQRGADFIRAVILGFETRDALALLRLDDLYIDSFEVRLAFRHSQRSTNQLVGQGC